MDKNIKLQTSAKRSSNLELYRIFLMLGIIAHHLVVNSGIISLYNFNDISFNMIFAQCFGAFGKIGTNCFVLITGYFMINKNITLKKFLKLYLEYKFYIIVFYLLFLITGYTEFSTNLFIKNVLFSTIYEAGNLFVGTYIIFFLLIPFLNILANNMNQKQYTILLAILITYFTLFPSLFLHETWNFTIWLCIVYLIGAYIKLFPMKFYSRQKTLLCLLIINLLLIFMSIISIDYLGSKFGFYNYYHFVADCNKLFAVTISILMFLVFKNINMKNTPIINIPASSTFGILLIHAISDDMRNFVWNDLFNIPKLFTSVYFPLYAVGITLFIYAICLIIDQIRIYLIEKPVFKYLDRHIFEKLNNKQKIKDEPINKEEKA